MKKTPKKAALSQTTEEYASRSSIHGISYIFDMDLHLGERLLWLAVVLVFLGVAATMTWNFWSQWRNEQVTIDLFFLTNSTDYKICLRVKIEGESGNLLIFAYNFLIINIIKFP